MSVISFPRRIETVRPQRQAPRRAATPTRTQPRRATRSSRWSSWSVYRRGGVILFASLMISLSGSMLVANRQIQIHALQTQLLQDQSSYAEQVGSTTNQSAPSQIATEAGSLHLVNPLSVTQVASTSLDAPLPLPKFLGYAPATSRTVR